MSTFTHVTSMENLLNLHQSQLSNFASWSHKRRGCQSVALAPLCRWHASPLLWHAGDLWDSNSWVFSRWWARPITLYSVSSPAAYGQLLHIASKPIIFNQVFSYSSLCWQQYCSGPRKGQSMLNTSVNKTQDTSGRILLSFSHKYVVVLVTSQFSYTALPSYCGEVRGRGVELCHLTAKWKKGAAFRVTYVGREQNHGRNLRAATRKH